MPVICISQCFNTETNMICSLSEFEFLPFCFYRKQWTVWPPCRCPPRWSNVYICFLTCPTCPRFLLPPRLSFLWRTAELFYKKSLSRSVFRNSIFSTKYLWNVPIETNCDTFFSFFCSDPGEAVQFRVSGRRAGSEGWSAAALQCHHLLVSPPQPSLEEKRRRSAYHHLPTRPQRQCCQVHPR